MGAPSGNQFWKLRSKHGRDKLFSTPQDLLTACQEYFNWVDAHPWFKNEQLKKPYYDSDLEKMITIAKIPTARPYTIYGLCMYLDCNSVWFNQFESSINQKLAKLKENETDNEAEDFSKILTHVREVIYQQKFEGAAVGAFNHNIIARDLNLRENVDHTTKGKELTRPPQVIIQSEKTDLPISETLDQTEE